MFQQQQNISIMVKTQKEFTTDMEKGSTVKVASLASLSACATAYSFIGFWIHGARAWIRLSVKRAANLEHGVQNLIAKVISHFTTDSENLVDFIERYLKRCLYFFQSGLSRVGKIEDIGEENFYKRQVHALDKRPYQGRVISENTAIFRNNARYFQTVLHCIFPCHFIQPVFRLNQGYLQTCLPLFSQVNLHTGLPCHEWALPKHMK